VTGSRISIYGLGRSGLAVARAALALGATPVVYDRAKAAQMVKQDTLEVARELGIELHLGWEGRFDPASTDLLVPNPGVDMRSPVLQQARTDGIEIVSEVEFACRVLEARSDPSDPTRGLNSRVPIVAITGTNGKSTTTVMTYLALKECGLDVVLCGNIYGTGLPEVPLTEAALHAKPNQVLVAEISSFQLEWVSHFSPAVAGITNIAPDHLDRYDSFQQYADTKMRIFAGQESGDYAVVESGTGFQAVSASGFQPESQSLEGSETHRLEGDATVTGTAGFQPEKQGLEGPETHRLEGDATVTEKRSPRIDAEPVLTFGEQGEHAQVRPGEIKILDKVIKTGDMQVIGVHNYTNAAMAGLLSWATIRWIAERSSTGGRNAPATVRECIVTALKAFLGIEHRMEFVGEKNGVKVINNSMCTNPDAVVASARAVDARSHLLMGGKDKDLPFATVRDFLAGSQNQAYLFGEAKDVLNKQLGGGFPTYNTLQDAFRAATEKARPGEVIMLAPGCASTDQFHDFRDRGNVFKQIAKEWLES